jgi:hypothetical protein
MAYKDGVISIYPDGSFVGYIPNKVFTALYRQGLIEKVAPKKWIIPEEKRDLVTNLKVVSEDSSPSPTPATTGLLGVKVGDVFYNSWGYDQTNIDFYVVTRLSATGKTAWVKDSGARNVSDDDTHFTEDALVPTGQPTGDREYKCKIKADSQGEPMLVSSLNHYSVQYLWRTKEGKRYHQTKPQFGH